MARQTLSLFVTACVLAAMALPGTAWSDPAQDDSAVVSVLRSRHGDVDGMRTRLGDHPATRGSLRRLAVDAPRSFVRARAIAVLATYEHTEDRALFRGIALDLGRTPLVRAAAVGALGRGLGLAPEHDREVMRALVSAEQVPVAIAAVRALHAVPQERAELSRQLASPAVLPVVRDRARVEGLLPAPTP